VHTAKVKILNVNSYGSSIVKDGKQVEVPAASINIQVIPDSGNSGIFLGSSNQSFNINVFDVAPRDAADLTLKTMTLTLTED